MGSCGSKQNLSSRDEPSNMEIEDWALAEETITEEDPLLSKKQLLPMNKKAPDSEAISTEHQTSSLPQNGKDGSNGSLPVFSKALALKSTGAVKVQAPVGGVISQSEALSQDEPLLTTHDLSSKKEKGSPNVSIESSSPLQQRQEKVTAFSQSQCTTKPDNSNKLPFTKNGKAGAGSKTDSERWSSTPPDDPKTLKMTSNVVRKTKVTICEDEPSPGKKGIPSPNIPNGNISSSQHQQPVREWKRWPISPPDYTKTLASKTNGVANIENGAKSEYSQPQDMSPSNEVSRQARDINKEERVSEVAEDIETHSSQVSANNQPAERKSLNLNIHSVTQDSSLLRSNQTSPKSIETRYSENNDEQYLWSSNYSHSSTGPSPPLKQVGVTGRFTSGSSSVQKEDKEVISHPSSIKQNGHSSPSTPPLKQVGVTGESTLGSSSVQKEDKEVTSHPSSIKQNGHSSPSTPLKQVGVTGGTTPGSNSVQKEDKEVNHPSSIKQHGHSSSRTIKQELNADSQREPKAAGLQRSTAVAAKVVTEIDDLEMD